MFETTTGMRFVAHAAELCGGIHGLARTHGQSTAPLALTGQSASTRPLRTQTYQS
jgi:hypothetical protein